MNLNNELKNYIENNIFKIYENNDKGHNIDHINYVIKRSLMFASRLPDINIDMVYTIASFHDIGHHIDPKNHEKVSSNILANDQNLKRFFNQEQIDIMADAVMDHRASSNSDPRNIYGKIVSSADKNTSIDETLRRTYSYRIKNNIFENINDIIEESRQHILRKFGRNGYAAKKMYFEDNDYEKYLDDVYNLALDEVAFKKRYVEINKIIIDKKNN